MMASVTTDEKPRPLLVGWWRRIPKVYIALLLLIIVLGIFSVRSIMPNNLLSMVRQGGPLGLAAIGQTFVLISGGLDLSVGSIVILADVMAAQMINGRPEMALPVSLLVLGIGAGIGLVNGVLITRFKITPFIATLSMNFIVFGAALVYSGGAPRGSIPPNMRFWGNGFLFDLIPSGAFVWVIVTLIAGLVLTRTVFGRNLMATGANPQAARHAGVNVEQVQTSAYVMSGFMAAAAGLLLVAFVGIGTLEIGTDFLLGSIAAAVIGGTPFEGGRGTIWGTFGGVLFLMVLYSILTVMALPTSGRRIVEGAIILIAISIYARGRRGTE